MRMEELLEELETSYPNDVKTLVTYEDLITSKAQQELLAHIRLIATNPKTKKGLGDG